MVPPIGVVSLSLRAGDVPSSRRPGVDNSGQCHDTHNGDTLRMPILPSSCGDRMSSAYFRALYNYIMHYTFLISWNFGSGCFNLLPSQQRVPIDVTTHFCATCLAEARF